MLLELLNIPMDQSLACAALKKIWSFSADLQSWRKYLFIFQKANRICIKKSFFFYFYIAGVRKRSIWCLQLKQKASYQWWLSQKSNSEDKSPITRILLLYLLMWYQRVSNFLPDSSIYTFGEDHSSYLSHLLKLAILGFPLHHRPANEARSLEVLLASIIIFSAPLQQDIKRNSTLLDILL